MYSLKKTGYFGFTGVAVLLVFVVILYARQYQLTTRYSTIISQSEEMIFQFSTIKEQITASLTKKEWQEVVTVADQLKKLHSTLLRLQENTLIPGEYRLDMAKQVDLSGLAISLKDLLATRGDKIAESLHIQNEMRTLAEYLMQFDRIIVSQMRAKVVQFQTVMIGALGAVICMISFSLILLYKKAMLPLLRLSSQAENPEIVQNGFIQDNDACTEIAVFTERVNTLFAGITANSGQGNSPSPDNAKFSAIINENTNLSNGIINYAQLLSDSYREVEIGPEETKIVQHIIEAAERIAHLNREI